MKIFIIHFNSWIKAMIILVAFYVLYFRFGNAFVYKSLFFYYVLILSAYILLALFAFKPLFNAGKIKLPSSTLTFLSVALLLLPFISLCITGKTEIYFTHHYICVFLLFIILSADLRSEFIKENTIGCLLMGFALCESVMCFLQYFEVIKTSGFFAVTGSNHNPNTTAMFLVMCLPAILKVFTEQKVSGKIIIGIIAFTMLVAIVLLKSRTAYAGVFVLVLFLSIFYLSKKSKLFLLVPFALLLVAVFAAPKLYHFKKDSADGRVFVWKVAVEMIAKRPLGYGYGMLQSTYNHAQADYFENKKTSEAEQRNAEYMNNLNNDYLELSVQGGIAGGILYLAFIFAVIVYGFKQKNVFALAGTLVFAVMSCFCFAFYSPQVAIVFAFYAALINAQTNGKTLYKAVHSVVAAAGATMLVCVSFQIYSQMQLKNLSELIKNKDIPEAKKMSGKIYCFVSTSEIYHRTLGDLYFAGKDYKMAAQYYQNAIDYAPFPASVSKLAYCEMHLKHYEKSERLLHLAANIQPSLFEPYLNLMMLYVSTNETEKAQEAARFISEKKPKRETASIRQYKDIATKILNLKNTER